MPWGLVVIAMWLAWVLVQVASPGLTTQQLGIVILASVASAGGAIAFGALMALLLRRLPAAWLPLATPVAEAFSGAAAGVVLVAVTSYAGIALMLPSWMAVLVPAIAAPWMLAAFSTVDRVRHEVLLERTELVREAHDLMVATSTQAGVVADIRMSIITAVDSELATARSDVELQLAALETAAPAPDSDGATSLFVLTDRSLRPVMTALQQGEPATPTRNVAASIYAIIRTQPFHPLVLVGIYVITSLPTAWVKLGPLAAVVEMTLGSFVILVVLSCANAIMRKARWRHDVVFITAFAILQVPTIWVTIIDASSIATGVVSSILTVLLSGALVLLISALGSWRERQEQAQSAFRGLLDEERIESLARAQVAAEVAREAAQHLHGAVQARLAACAVAMETAARSGDVEAYRTSLMQAHAALSSPVFSDPTSDQLPLPAALASVMSPWSGFVETTLHIAPELTDVASTEAEHIVEEGITNAVRHGRAHTVDIRLEVHGDRVLVTIDDDGTGLGSNGPGLGSRMIDRLTNGSWELGPSSHLPGTRLRATVTLPPAGAPAP